jgi:dTMP kinase
MGKLIVIESGTDASGKTTQIEKLYKRLKDEGYSTEKVDFPDYQNPSSILVRMYLQGEFGRNPREINPYAASTFFAVDRFASYQKKWKELYHQGTLIIADRYTTSNMIHQASKIEDEEEKEKFLEWLRDLEFNKLQLPEPDLVIFLDVPPLYSQEILRDRSEKDIHELDLDYLRATYQNACWVAQSYRWQRIDCIEAGKLRSIEEIHEEIYSIVLGIL